MNDTAKARPGDLAGPSWTLVSYSDGGPSRAGARRADGAIVPLPGAARTLLEVLEDWERLVPELRAFDADTAAPLAAAKIRDPLEHRPTILCAGANYHGHLKEMGVAEAPSGIQPYFFIKPMNSVVGDGTAVAIPTNNGAKIDWEAELAVVIGKPATAVDPEDALSVVAGYLPFNDITDRSRLDRDTSLAPPFRYDWVGAKVGDQFGPFGNGIVPAFLVDDPQDLKIRLWVSGELKQDSSTSDMLHPIGELIAAASRTVTLLPGDIIATGTPAGVGVPRGEFLQPQDVVEIEIEGVGRLSNPIVAR